MPEPKISDADLEKLKVSNSVIREIIGARLPIQNLKAENDQGTITLRGTAPDAAVKQQAVAIASRVAGVRHVDDKLEVGGAGAASGSSGARTYTVKKGDTLSEIAQRELGAASRW